VNLRHQRLSK